MAKHPRKTSSDASVAQLIEQIRDLEEQLESERLFHEASIESQRVLERSRERYSTLFDKAPAGYLIFDHRGIIRDINLTAAQMLGKDRAAIIGMPLLGFVDKADSRSLLSHFGHLRDRESEVATELHLKKNSKVLKLQTVISDMETGSRHEYYGILADVSEIKRAEKILRESKSDLERRVAEQTAEISKGYAAAQAERQRLFDVMETLPVMICLLTSDHRIAFANSRFREKFGESDDRHCYERCFNFEEPCGLCEAYKTLKKNQSHHWEYTAPDGSVMDIYDFPFADSDGTKMVLEMEIDITDRRRAENELREAQTVLEDRAAQLRALATELTLTEQRERNRLALVLHDGLQQMLVAAKYQVAMLGRSKDSAEAAGQISSLIDDCIQTSRSLTAELSPPILHKGGLVPALEWLVQWMRDKHGLTVELISQGNQKPPEEIAVLLFQSVRELLLNITKHAGTREARIGVRQFDGHIQVEVADQGVGFDPEQTIKRADIEKSGMGLFSIRERLGYLDGTMEIESAPGRGARFILSAPTTSQPGKPPEHVAASKASVSFIAQNESKSTDGKIRVALVDDHMVVRQGLASLLRSEPDILVVGEASDGRSAIDLVRETRPAVVLMDISMPGMNGLEATRLIHEQMPEVKVIGLSMFKEGDQAAEMIAAGASKYLVKSDPSEIMLEAIRDCVQPSDRSVS